MKPKPSLRRDSLEKAALKMLYTWPHYETMNQKAKMLVLFATRHGAKVRRECAELALGYTKGDRQLYEMILALTPRGPEKGRRAK